LKIELFTKWIGLSGGKKKVYTKREFSKFQNWNWGAKMGEYISKRGKRHRVKI
jgi:hypothetical protein